MPPNNNNKKDTLSQALALLASILSIVVLVWSVLTFEQCDNNWLLAIIKTVGVSCSISCLIGIVSTMINIVPFYHLTELFLVHTIIMFLAVKQLNRCQ